jgi:DNA-directed RNA polymerase specialized sigma24 family protein
VDEALNRLSERSRLQAQIVELRVFAGMTCEEVAEVLHVRPRTVRRHWAVAQAWLRCELGDQADGSGTLV